MGAALAPPVQVRALWTSLRLTLLMYPCSREYRREHARSSDSALVDLSSHAAMRHSKKGVAGACTPSTGASTLELAAFDFAYASVLARVQARACAQQRFRACGFVIPRCDAALQERSRLRLHPRYRCEHCGPRCV